MGKTIHIIVALFVGALLGVLGHIGARALDGTTPLHAPVRAAKLDADLEDEQELGRRIISDLHWARQDLDDCKKRRPRVRRKWKATWRVVVDP